MALAAFLNRPGLSRENRRLAMAIAAKAVERRNELFQGYFWRALEALAEMGALARVERDGERLHGKEAIMLPYDRRYGPSPQFMMAQICRAKLRSVVVSAGQEGITLPPEWLVEYRKEQYAAITVLAQASDSDLRHAADAALKDLNGSSE
jgi:hypothetical protein